MRRRSALALVVFATACHRAAPPRAVPPATTTTPSVGTFTCTMVETIGANAPKTTQYTATVDAANRIHRLRWSSAGEENVLVRSFDAQGRLVEEERHDRLPDKAADTRSTWRYDANDHVAKATYRLDVLGGVPGLGSTVVFSPTRHDAHGLPTRFSIEARSRYPANPTGDRVEQAVSEIEYDEQRRPRKEIMAGFDGDDAVSCTYTYRAPEEHRICTGKDKRVKERARLVDGRIVGTEKLDDAGNVTTAIDVTFDDHGRRTLVVVTTSEGTERTTYRHEGECRFDLPLVVIESGTPRREP